MNISHLFTALIAASLVTHPANLLAQTSPEPAPVVHLTGTSWQLVRFQSSDGMTLTPDDKSRYTLAFEDGGRVSAQIDCNRGTGSWNSAGPGQLRFGPLATTRAMCPSTPLNKRLPKDFEYVRSYTLKEGHLVLSLMADGGIYEFELLNTTSSTSPQSSVPLENTNWTLTQLGTTPVNADSQRGPNITFNSEQHRVSGSGGCNRIMGGYSLEGDRVKFTQMASSMMACVNGMDTERAFLDALGNADSLKITGDKLELYDASGTAVATFQSVPAKQ